MPFYEYLCEETNTLYTFFTKRILQGEPQVRCPDYPEYQLKRQYSVFSVTGQVKEGEGTDDMSDQQAEVLMARMEKMASGMDTENPDPRQMGRMMEEMASASGQKMDDVTEEMIQKLKEGADPDQLEADMGAYLDNDSCEQEEFSSVRQKKRVKKDPQVYALEDYVING